MADAVLASQLLSFAALVAATVEYREILRRRVVTRRQEAEQRAAYDAGLRGMVRVFLAEH
ncbi:MAG TPA: hypothetical protein VFU44_00260 [Candidatus Limnocylindria bacterium]|jgi:hypothetical protein|nr:hypothetical protein [Candidatus Limnocylindria bacterium]HEU4862186.1 hypothetical protein [Candidatus Limnocylindria bacterium]